MTDRRVTRALSAAGVVALGAGGLAVAGAAAPAAAFTGSCPETTPAATLVADGVCEVRITAAGPATFTAPSGIQKLSAVLVGGGASGNFYSLFFTSSTGGGGGSVVYLDSVPFDAPIEVNVGAGGSPLVFSPGVTPGGATTLGDTSAAGGDSTGSAQCATSPFDTNGGGARTAATGDPVCAPGAGFLLSELATDASLFPAAADGGIVYGGGGSGTGGGSQGPVSGPVSTLHATPHKLKSPAAAPVMILAASTSPFPGTGGSSDPQGAAAGAAGAVILRFAVPAAPAPSAAPSPAVAAAPTLPATGSDIAWSTAPIAVGAVGLGALLLAAARRRRRPRRG